LPGTKPRHEKTRQAYQPLSDDLWFSVHQTGDTCWRLMSGPFVYLEEIEQALAQLNEILQAHRDTVPDRAA
jgi:hypothetical protein